VRILVHPRNRLPLGHIQIGSKMPAVSFFHVSSIGMPALGYPPSYPQNKLDFLTFGVEG
jgi:hypothetical protein